MIRTTIFAAALLTAGSALAQEPMTWLESAAYKLSGGNYRGAVIRSDDEQTTEVEEAHVGFGQNLRHGWHSRDRERMSIALTSIDRDTGQRQSFVGAFVATIRDLGDQGRGSPARITLRAADGSIIDSIRIRGGTTKKWNRNTRTVAFSGPLSGATLVVKSSAGKFNLNPFTGDRGDGDGFSVKVRTADDCPEDEGPNMTITTARRVAINNGPYRNGLKQVVARERSRETIDSPPQVRDRSRADDDGRPGRGNPGRGGKGGGKRK